MLSVLSLGYTESSSATPLYLAKFEAMLDSGLGGLPPTLLQVRYVFDERPPFLVVPHEAYYEFRSFMVTLNGVEYPALPLDIGVQDDLPVSGYIRRDAYFVVGTVSGTYEVNFELSSAGLEFVKFGSPPEALSDLNLPTSVAALSGFTVESELDHRIAFLSFENRATGEVISNSGSLTSFTIERVGEPGSLALLGLGLAGLGFARQRRVRAVVGWVALAALSLGYMEPSRATPLRNIDGIGTETGFILWIPGEGPGVYSMKHDAAAGRSTYLQQGAWDYTPWFESVDPPVFAGFEGVFAWTAGIAPDGRVTDPGSMLFVGDLGAGDEVLIGGQLERVGVLDQGPSEWDDGTVFHGLQYLFALSFVDPRLSALGNALRFDFPTIVESVYDSPFHEDFELGADSLWSDPGLIGLTVPEPGSLALLGLGLAGLGWARRRAGER